MRTLALLALFALVSSTAYATRIQTVGGISTSYAPYRLNRASAGAPAGAVAPPTFSLLFLEDGSSYLLLENGDRLALEL